RRARLGCASRESPDPAGRVDRPVVGVPHPAVEPARERPRKLVEPLGLEAVRTKRLEFRPDLLPLLGVGRDSEAADAPEGIAGERPHAIDVTLRQQPEVARAFRSELAPRDVVRHRAAPEREAAVATARAGRDLPPLVAA